MKADGKALVIITHKLHEVMDVSDRVAVLRKGRYIGDVATCDTSPQKLTDMMVGHAVTLNIDRPLVEDRNLRLEVKDLTVLTPDGIKALDHVSFDAYGGEILGIAGVEGNGQRELIEIITGLRPIEDGTIKIGGKDSSHFTVRQIRDAKVGHIPQDRLTYGAAGDSTIAENLISDKSDSPTVSNGPFLSAKKIKDYCTRLIRDFEIKCADENVLVRMLSGGNMQKVVVARELTGDLSLVIADQPTRGIDVGTAKAIHEKLVELRDSGVAVLLVSADLNEIMELSDSMIVMYDGEIVAYFEDASTLTEAELGQYMLGVQRQTEDEIREVCYEQ